LANLEFEEFLYSDSTEKTIDKLNEMRRLLDFGINFGNLSTANVNSTIGDVVTNFNGRNDRSGISITLPTIATDGTAVDHIIATDSSAAISFEWAWAGNNADIDGWIIYVHQLATSSTYSFGDTPPLEQAYLVAAEKRVFYLSGVPADKFYTLGVQAYRRVDPDVAASGLVVTPIIKPTRAEEAPYRPSANVAFAGDITGTINSVAVATVLSDISTAQADANTAITNAATAQTAANTAQTTADGKIETFYQATAPHTEYTNVSDNANYNKLVGDMWYDSDSAVKKTYRYTKTANGANFNYAWTYLEIPTSVYDVIDGKRTVFMAEPTVPYYVGDLWITSTSASTGDFKKCITQRLTGSYTAAEWVVATESRPNIAYGIQDCSALFHYDTHLKSTQGLAPVGTPVATLRPGEGKFGGAVAVEEGTTNLLTANQSSVETNTTGFTAVNAATLTRDTAQYYSGVSSLKAIFDNVSWFEGIQVDSVTASAGVTYSAQVRLKASGNLPSIRIYLSALNAADADIGQAYLDVALTTSWQLFKIENFVTPATTAKLRIWVVSIVQEAGTIYYDYGQIEQKSFATSWTLGGTTRAAGSLKYPKSILNAAEGTIYGQFNLSTVNSSAYQGLLGADGSPRLLIGKEATTNFLKVWEHNGTSEIIFGNSTALVASTWYSFAYTWGASGRALYLDGASVATNARNTPLVLPDVDIPIGSWNGYFLNGLLDELRIDTKQRTAEEIKAWHDSNVAFVDAGQSQLADNTEITASGLKVSHSDGSYTLMEAEGIKRYVAGTGKTYHYMIETGSASSTHGTYDSGRDIYGIPADVTVTLPSEFQGKSFKVSVSLVVYDKHAGWLQSMTCQVVSIDTTNGTFTVTANCVAMASPNYYADYGTVTFSYTAIV
jgi:hypothetical protein